MRMPLRLGDDAFLRGEISPAKAWQLIKTLSGFRCLMDAYQPLAYRAVATSAVRRLYVPQIGLADGIVRQLYERHRTPEPHPVGVESDTTGLPA